MIEINDLTPSQLRILMGLEGIPEVLKIQNLANKNEVAPESSSEEN